MTTEKEQSESEYTRRLSKALEYIGCMVEPIVGSRMNNKGRPDRYIMHRLWHGWIEAKKYSVSLSAHQKLWHQLARRRQPWSVYIIRYYPDRNAACVFVWDYTINMETLIKEFPLAPLIKKEYYIEDSKYLNQLINIFANPLNNV